MKSLTRTLMILPLIGACFLAVGGCDISLTPDPATSVTVEISGISSESDREQVKEIVQGLTDGSSYSMSSTSTGDSMSITISPVSDVQAFAESIPFGEVTAVEGKTVKVKY